MRFRRRALDLADEIAVRRRRGRVLGVILTLELPATLGPPQSPGVDASPAVLAVTVLACLLGVALVLRPERVGDRAFLAGMLLLVGTMVPTLLATTPAGSLRSSELVLLIPLVIGTVFCGQRWHAVVVTAACTLAAVVLSVRRLAGLPDMGSELIGEVITFVTMGWVLRALRDSARTALLDARQREMTDPLTGLPNRRGFEGTAWQIWQRRHHDREPIAVIAVDVDHFKQVNDTYGHAAGDRVLRALGRLLQAALRPGDVAARLGGEEFAVVGPVLPGGAGVVAERLRALVETELAPITVSIGVLECVPDLGPDGGSDPLWRALECADTCLYEAKRRGRNRVVGGP